MPELKIPVNTFMVQYECDKCKEGYLTTVGQKPAIDNRSTIYMHKCLKCGIMAEFKDVQYPHPEFRKIKDEK